MANAANGAAFQARIELGLGPRKQGEQGRGIKAVAYLEVILGGGNRVLVPGFGYVNKRDQDASSAYKAIHIQGLSTR